MSTASELIQRWWLEKTWADNLARQQLAAKLIAYYAGEQLDYLELVLDDQFADPKALKLQLGMDNITQMIADRISRVFDTPPVLTCENAAGQALLDSLTADGRFALTLKTAEVYSNLAGVAALHPWFDDRRGKIKTRLFGCNALWAIQADDDPTEADAILYTQQQRDTVGNRLSVNYTYWDLETTRRFDSSGVTVTDETENPYGVVPFAFLRDQIPVDSFFTPIGDALVTAQDTLNVMLTELNQLLKMQSFSQPVFIGINDPKTPITVDPSRPIKIPPSQRDETAPDFKFVSPHARITEVMDAITRHVERVCKRYDINVDVLDPQGSVISGYALRLSDKGLNRRRTDALPLARECLLSWWEIVKAINNYHNVGAQVPPDAEITIDFAEPVYDDDPATVADTDQKRLDQGIISPIDIIKRDNPDLDDAQAEAVYRKNMSMKQATIKQYGLSDLVSGRRQNGA